MNLRLERQRPLADRTIGRLFVAGEPECWTLEDQVRADPEPATPANEAKVPGATAIPAGRYRVAVTWSPHFGQALPLLEAVPGFTGVRIHAGNVPADTQGCVLVGQTVTSDDALSQSRAALAGLLPLLVAAQSASPPEPIWLEVVDAPAETLNETAA